MELELHASHSLCSHPPKQEAGGQGQCEVLEFELDVGRLETQYAKLRSGCGAATSLVCLQAKPVPKDVKEAIHQMRSKVLTTRHIPTIQQAQSFLEGYATQMRSQEACRFLSFRCRVDAGVSDRIDNTLS